MPLRKFNKLYHLRGIGTFNKLLIKKWDSFMKRAARKYTVPGKEDADDLYQEFCVILWGLTKRVDPNHKPLDFTKLFKTEISNKGVDVSRWYKAKKRLKVLGKARECQLCGLVASWVVGESPNCPNCGAIGKVREDTKNITWRDVRARDVSGDATNATGNIFWDLCFRNEDPIGPMISRELSYRISTKICPWPDMALFEMLTNPPDSLLALMVSNEYPMDISKVPYWLLAKALGGGVSEKDLRMSYTRIAVATAQEVDRLDLVHKLSKYNLEHIKSNYFSWVLDCLECGEKTYWDKGKDPVCLYCGTEGSLDRKKETRIKWRREIMT